MSRNDAAFPGEILPAPPVHQGGGSYIGYPGLTKRELFAAMAMQGMIGAIDSAWNPEQIRQLFEFAPSGAVKMADGLIAELAK